MFWYLKNFESVTSYEMQQNMFITSWPAAGADFSAYLGSILGGRASENFLKDLVQIPPPNLVFQNFLEKEGVFQVLSPDMSYEK